MALSGPFTCHPTFQTFFFMAHSLKLAIVLALLVLLVHLPSFGHHLLIILGGAARKVVQDLGLGTGGEGLQNMSLCLHLLIFQPSSTHHTGRGSQRSCSGSGLGNWWRESDGIWALTGRGLADDLWWSVCAVQDNSGFTFILFTSSHWTHFDCKTENTANEHRHINPPSYLHQHCHSIYADFGVLLFCFSVQRVLFGVFDFFFGGGTQVRGLHFVEGGYMDQLGWPWIGSRRFRM